jgi:hypothetical protein
MCEVYHSIHFFFTAGFTPLLILQHWLQIQLIGWPVDDDNHPNTTIINRS